VPTAHTALRGLRTVSLLALGGFSSAACTRIQVLRHSAQQRSMSDPVRKRPKPRLLARVVNALTSFSKSHTGLVCNLAFILGLTWVFLFPAVCVTTGEAKMRGTYMSENSLSAGYTPSTFGRAEIEAAHARDDLFRSIALQATSVADYNTLLTEQLEKDLKLAGLEVYTKTFDDIDGDGVNVWGILRGNRASGTESMVLATSFADISPTKGRDPSGLSFLVTFVEHLASAKWLAKDIVFLITSSSLQRSQGLGVGLHRWLEAYHASLDESILHVGRIRAGLILDMQGGNYSSLAVPLPGINGGLPNLDMFNLWAQQWGRRGAPLRSKHGTHSLILPAANANDDAFSRLFFSVQTPLAGLGDNFRLYADRATNILRFMYQLAFAPSGTHAHFLRYNIDAMTLEPTTQYDPSRTWGLPMGASRSNSGFSTVLLAQTLEDVLHSMSNLEERLHQSFYFYFLANEKNFVSIDEYIFSLGILLSPCPIIALVLMSRGQVDFVAGASFVMTAALSTVAGLFAITSVQITTDAGPLYIGAAAICVLLVLHPMLTKALRTAGRSVAELQESIRAVVLILVFFSHMSCGLLNFPLALFSALAHVPVMIANGSHALVGKVLASGALILCSPPAILAAQIALTGGDSTFSGAVEQYLAEWVTYGSIPFAFFTVVVLPLQLTTLSMLWLR